MRELDSIDTGAAGAGVTRRLLGAAPGAPEVPGLFQRLRQRAAAEPGRPAFTFLADGEREERHLTWGELDGRARAIAARLQALSLAGERLLLLLPPGLDYLCAFAGSLYAGAVAVPAPPPGGRRSLPRLQAVLADCRPRAILGAAAARSTMERLYEPAGRPSSEACPLLAIDSISLDEAAGWRETEARSEDVAFLQYTSGSTSTPKGVMVSHGNLLANQRMIQDAFSTDEGSVVVSWLPPYHDMGLIGGLLHPLYLGARCVLLSPLHFLQRPRRWLEVISRYRASVSGGPNFAYDLCARRAATGARDANGASDTTDAHDADNAGGGLDLSSWRVAFNGAEPVRAEAQERFAAAFAAAGFRRTAFFPCYGLAEATLLVSGGRPPGRTEATVSAAPPETRPCVGASPSSPKRGQGEREVATSEECRPATEAGRPTSGECRLATEAGRPGGGPLQLVGCGRVAVGLDVQVVDPASCAESAAGEVGEIWVAGESVARGYWARPEESVAAFGAALAGRPGRFLRTGDLGFLRGGELYIAGRIKDLIILRGRNLHPQDIEWTAAHSHPSLRPGGGAAFGIEVEGEERLVVVQETAAHGEAALAAAAAAIRRAVAEEHEVRISSLVLVRSGAVPRTTSGKVRRRSCRDLYLAGQLAALAEWTEWAEGGARGAAEPAEPMGGVAVAGRGRLAPRTPAEERVARIWEEVLSLPPGTVGADDDFFVLGGDSLRGSQLLARLDMPQAPQVPQETTAGGVTLPDPPLTLDDLFATPTVAGLAERLAERLAARAVQAADLLGVPPGHRGQAAGSAAAAGSPPGAAPPPLPRADRSGPLPLTSTQRRLWFLDQVEPGNPAYNLAVTLRLAAAAPPAGRREPRRSAEDPGDREDLGGPADLDLDQAACAAALAEIVRRHEALRTVFRVVEGAPVQVVLPLSAAVGLTLPLVDLSGLAGPAAAAAGERCERQIARRPFALARGPLLCSCLVRRARGECHLHLVLHHIVADGWSLQVLVRELVLLYAAFSRRRPAPLPELPAQFADHACGEALRHAGPAFAARLAALRQRLGDSPPALELPADHPRPAVRTSRGAHLARNLPAPLPGRLRAFAAARGATQFVALLAGFVALAERITGEDDLVVGTAAANRERVELWGAIGCFVNTLALRLDASGDPPFAALLARVRETLLAALADRDLPFERLIDRSEARRDPSRPPLVQVMVVQQDAPSGLPPLPGFELTAREVDNGTARFDLALSLLATEEGLQAVWKYSRDLFEAVTVERMAAHYAELLSGAALEPGRRLSELPLLAAAERHQIVCEWNATGRERDARRCPAGPVSPAAAGPAACLHELFAAQVERTPDGVAVVFEEHCVTYAELHRRAGRLARLLLRLGVGADVLVGVAVERSPELVTGLLGVLAAGGAYLPLDPSYPVERLAFMLEDARAPVLLTTERLRGRLPAGRARVLGLDAVAGDRGDRGDRDGGGGGAFLGAAADGAAGPAAEVSPESLAYTIYTSGSTGLPKGSMISHRAIVNRLLWMQEEYRLAPGEGVLQKTPTSFDVSVWELFWPLITGARLVLARPGGHQDSAYLAGLMADAQVSTVHFVPSMLQVFLTEPRLPDCRALRRVIASGEALPGELAARFHALLGDAGVELHNLYGPTEAAVDVTAWAVGREGGVRLTVPIGRPIANLRIHLLERGGAPVPVRVPGHLHIAGVGLSRGYLGRPDRTAERFVPDPWGEPGGRLYATGDLARWRPDGALEFLGRLDLQVKLRGFRIELGEIEAALEAHPAVRQAVVAARREPAGDRLIAYLLGQDGEAAPDAEDLRSHLAARLPEPMLPAAFVVLPAFPLTASGKVDRKRLPAPAAAAAARGARGDLGDFGDLRHGRVAPRTALEARLAAMWREQLGVAEVGVDDDFFALGGDSIQGALLINRLQRELGTILYVMTLFDAPTVARFAAHLERSCRRELVAAGWIAAPAGAAGTPGTADLPETAGGSETAGEPEAESEPETAADLPALPTPPPLPTAAALAELERHLATRFSPGTATATATAAAAAAAGTPANPSAVFILSPFRSGSTLLRVMLAGHPRLFAPPELELLGFVTMGERRRAFSGRDGFAREGLLRAVMELRGCDAAGATALVAAAEERDEPVPAFYRRLQEWAGPRLLVDKTPRYCLHLPTLRRAGDWFAAPRFIHLVRHPETTIASYLAARLDEVHGFPLPRRQQAELIWAHGHETILGCLAGIPAERQHRVRFEDLVRHPREVMEELCSFLGIDFHPAVLTPYEGERMTDGLVPGGRMLGDPKFHQHRGIDPRAAGPAESADPEDGAHGMDNADGVAGAGRRATALPHLAPATRRLAARLGYPPPDLPLSFAQQRLWFLDRLETTPGLYHMPAAVRLDGALDVPALARARAEIERRHEVLRTVFPDRAGRPRQVVPPPRPPQPSPTDLLPLLDLGALPAPTRRAEAARLLAAEAEHPFDLAAGPLWRMRLVRLAAGEHLLLVNLHHIVCDGWSVGILTRELADLYAAFRQGERTPLADPPWQYADFALWQRNLLAGDGLEQHLRYWRRQLAAPLPVLALPTDRRRPAVRSARGAQLPLRVPQALVTPLREVAASAGATLFMVLAAGLQALLQAYTGQLDLLIATVTAHRHRAELEDLIGVFVNTLVLRTDLSGDPGFGTLLLRVRQVCLEAIRHQELPFEKLIEELGHPRAAGLPPLDAVMLALQNAPRRAMALSGLTLERLPIPSRIAKSELSLDLSEGPDGLRGVLEYSTDLFDATTMQRLAGHLLELLGSAAERSAPSDRRLSELSLLGAAERHQIVVEWNATEWIGSPPGTGEPPSPPPACLHELFTAQAERTPDAVAVAAQDLALTYGELDRRADRLASLLRWLGVGPEVLAGVAVERSPALVVALLAVLKAGGAYLPLDPSYPTARLAFMLEDARAPVLLTEERLRGQLPAGPAGGARVVTIDASGAGDAAGAAGEPLRSDSVLVSQPAPDPAVAAAAATAPAAVGPDHLAYTIYTSGSTGQPKGSQISHRAIVDHLLWVQRRLPLAPSDVVVLKTPISFDASIWEIFVPLAAGARIEVARPRGELDAVYLARLILSRGATVLQVVPSMLAVFLAEPAALACTSLRRVICGSETLSAPLRAEYHARLAADLHNLYGPTECSIDATHWACPPAPPGPEGSAAEAVPIGRPIDNVQVHLLDRWLRPVPVGVPGHLHIGGAGLARGYRGRPELTAERFVPDPLSRPDPLASPLDAAGRRLYATGDLARFRPDGAIEFLGRFDHQVKLRGFRIELGEIEACLSSHPAVREAVVVARGDRRERGGWGEGGEGVPEGGPRLVGYVVAREGVRLEADELRAHAAARLPEPMVPQTFVQLAALPLGPGEKVDRGQLPEPAADRLAARYTAPETAHERLIAEVWREVLAVERVGIHDNFFELGGHSLLAAEVHGKLRERLALDFPLLDLFQHPTVAALAGRLRREGQEPPETLALAGRVDQVRRESEAVRRRRRALAGKR